MRDKNTEPSKHARSISEMDADSVRVQFSPNMRRAFARLEAAVCDSTHFSPEILQNLQEYANGKSLSVQGALTGIAMITSEATGHVNATGDKRAEQALSHLIGQLMEEGPNPPITLVKSQAKRR